MQWIVAISGLVAAVGALGAWRQARKSNEASQPTLSVRFEWVCRDVHRLWDFWDIEVLSLRGSPVLLTDVVVVVDQNRRSVADISGEKTVDYEDERTWTIDEGEWSRRPNSHPLVPATIPAGGILRWKVCTAWAYVPGRETAQAPADVHVEAIGPSGEVLAHSESQVCIMPTYTIAGGP